MRAYLASDHAEVVAWYTAHGQNPPAPEDLPSTGLIVAGVAAGFLYRTDSSLCLVEGVVTNPAAPARARAQAVSMIIDGLLWQASGVVVGICKSPGMARRAARHGLRAVGVYTVLVR